MSVLLVLEGAIVFYVCQCVSMSDEAGEEKRGQNGVEGEEMERSTIKRGMLSFV